MPKLETDDDIQRHNRVYLGPEGYTFPVELTYAQYGLYGAATAVGVLVGAVAHSSLVACWLIPVCWIAAKLIWRRVDPDRNVRNVLGTYRRDWRRTRRPAAALPAQRVAVTRVRFSTSQNLPRPPREIGGPR